MGIKLKLANVRLSYPDLWTAKAFDEKGEAKFGGTFIIPKDHQQIEEVKGAVTQCLKDAFGDKAGQVFTQIKANAQKCSFRDSDELYPDKEESANAYLLVAKNKVRPRVLNRDKSQCSEEDGAIYAGCYVNAVVELYAYDFKGKGLAASLMGVQKFSDGDAFGGQSVASESDFDDFGDTGESGDPAAEFF